eukprot:jgi/Mesvir1/28746/Mv19715-RA.1
MAIALSSVASPRDAWAAWTRRALAKGRVTPSPSQVIRTTVTGEAGAGSGSGKTVLITGANTGIGKVAALRLAEKGYDIILACRDTEKGEDCAKYVKEQTRGAATPDVVKLDLGSLKSVRECAARVKDARGKVDVLLNNAGVMACPKMQTEDGFEYQLGVNHLGHHLLTSLLMDRVLAAGTPSANARVINVSSSAHSFGKINFDDIMSNNKYEPWPAYGQSKLANILFTYELARRLPTNTHVTANCLHPGLVATELGRYLLPANVNIFQQLMFGAMRMMAKTPEQGAETSIYLASSPQVEGVTGKYFVDCAPKASTSESYDLETARKLWDLSNELTKASWPSALTS